MNEDIWTDESATICGVSHKPAWWTESLETSWLTVKGEALLEWRTVTQYEDELELRVYEEAFAFGHGAREWYDDLDVWSIELEARLKADWRMVGHRVECAWDRVSAVVRRGWERAGGPGAGPAGRTFKADAEPPFPNGF